MAIMLNFVLEVYENFFFSASQLPDSSILSRRAGIAVPLAVRGKLRRNICRKVKNILRINELCLYVGVPNGIRTRVATLKGWCPRPG